MNDLKIVSQELALKQGASGSASLPASSAGGSEPSASASVSTQVREESNQAQQPLESTPRQVEEAVANLNEYVQSVQRDLQFRLDDNSGKTVITVYDRTTEEVVRQIPDDVALRLARDLQQDEPISLFNAKV